MAEKKPKDCDLKNENKSGCTAGIDLASSNLPGSSAESTRGNGNARDDNRKLFVGGLSWETSEKELEEHFSKFGEIQSIDLKRDTATGSSRGFGYIVFTTTDAIDKVKQVSQHIIDNRIVDPKQAKPRHGKIFVGGLTNEISDYEIIAYFGQFGTIFDVDMPFDKEKSQREEFCFITYNTIYVLDELLKSPKHKISGREIHVTSWQDYINSVNNV